MQNEMGYIVAKGPEGLTAVLDDLLAQSKADPGVKEKDHYILFELGSQKSLIKMDMTVTPFLFWHYDLLGRPATATIKEVLARFAWEKCGQKESYLKEHKLAEDDETYLEWRLKVFEGKEGT
jgi:hypothetical protein